MGARMTQDATAAFIGFPGGGQRMRVVGILRASASNTRAAGVGPVSADAQLPSSTARRFGAGLFWGE